MYKAVFTVDLLLIKMLSHLPEPLPEHLAEL